MFEHWVHKKFVQNTVTKKNSKAFDRLRTKCILFNIIYFIFIWKSFEICNHKNCHKVFVKIYIVVKLPETNEF